MMWSRIESREREEAGPGPGVHPPRTPRDWGSVGRKNRERREGGICTLGYLKKDDLFQDDTRDIIYEMKFPEFLFRCFLHVFLYVLFQVSWNAFLIGKYWLWYVYYGRHGVLENGWLGAFSLLYKYYTKPLNNRHLKTTLVTLIIAYIGGPKPGRAIVNVDSLTALSRGHYLHMYSCLHQVVPPHDACD
jgi:hypothetical protein